MKFTNHKWHCGTITTPQPSQHSTQNKNKKERKKEKMVLLLLKEMKGSKLLCASPSSTAICKSIDHQSLYQVPKTRQLASKIPQSKINRQNLQRQKSRKRRGKADDDHTSSQWLLSKYREEDNTLSHWNLPETDNGDELVSRMTSASNKSPSCYQVYLI